MLDLDRELMELVFESSLKWWETLTPEQQAEKQRILFEDFFWCRYN